MFSHVSVHPSICLSMRGGYPSQVQPGEGTPARSTLFTPHQTWLGGTPARGGTLPGSTPPLVPPPIRPGQGGTLPEGVPHLGSPIRPAWGATLPGVPHFGKQMEYLIRLGRYASCVHAGGLSCLHHSMNLGV